MKPLKNLLRGLLAVCSFIAAIPAVAEPPQPGPQWTNSLGMKFVPVPGTAVLFSIWDTRVQDYQAFVTATERDGGKKPDFEQGPTHPVVMVSWDDAKAFCAWLTEKERSTGTLTPNQEYRWACEKRPAAHRGSVARKSRASIRGAHNGLHRAGRVTTHPH